MKCFVIFGLLLSTAAFAQGYHHEDLLDINIAKSGMDKKRVKEYLSDGSPTKGKNKCLQGSMSFIKPKLEGKSPFFIIKNQGKVLVAIGQSCAVISCESDFLANPIVDFPPVFVEKTKGGQNPKRVIFKGDYSGLSDPAIDWEKGSVVYSKEGKFTSQNFDDDIKNLKLVGQIESFHEFKCGENQNPSQTGGAGSGGGPVKDKKGGLGNAGAQ